MFFVQRSYAYVLCALLLWGRAGAAVQAGHNPNVFRRQCLTSLAPQYASVLGDLRRFAGTKVPFRDVLPRSGGLRVGYELEVELTVDTSLFVRQLAHDLRAFSEALDDNVEIAVVAVEISGQGPVVYYRSDEHASISMQSYAGAFRRLLERVRGHSPLRRSIERFGGAGITVHRIHVHPAGYSAPHSAYDVIGAVRRLREYRDVFGASVQYESHVLPLEYNGELLFTFEPAEHRVY